MPVLLAGRDDYDVTGRYVLRRLSPCLHANPALDHEQPLRARVRVPVGACARLELDVVDDDRRGGIGLRLFSGVHRADERARIAGGVRYILTAKDDHADELYGPRVGGA